MTPEEETAQLMRLATGIGKARDADVLFYNGDIGRPHDDTLIEKVVKRRRRKNVFLVLCTYGGDPHAAYRMARCLQDKYTKVTVAVAGFCKSAGTLMLLGAHSLLLLENAELGPLDIQLRKSDELDEFGSGLTPTQALDILSERALITFHRTFTHLKSELLMTTKTAADVASAISTALYEPIMAQLDPMRTAEMDRAVSIVSAYGDRLLKRGGNVKEGALSQLVAGYPSHMFVIDRREAEDLFKKVDKPADDESEFCERVESFARRPLDRVGRPAIFFLNIEQNQQTQDDANAQVDSENNAATDERPGREADPPPASDGAPPIVQVHPAAE